MISEVNANYFKNLLKNYQRYVNDTKNSMCVKIDATYGLKGKASKWKDLEGGATQIVTPFSGIILERLGIIL